MFSYKRISREESDQPREYPLLKDGVYSFKTEVAKFKYSQAGNPMIELQNVHYDSNGQKYVVFDYLMDTEKMGWKTRHYCDAVGLGQYYDEDKFNEHMCEGREGYFKVKMQPKREVNGIIYNAKNSVEDYVMNVEGQVKSDLEPPKVKAKVDDFDTQDIPF